MRAPPSPYIAKSFSMPIVPHPPPTPKPPSSAQKLTRKKPKVGHDINVRLKLTMIRRRPRVLKCLVLSTDDIQ